MKPPAEILEASITRDTILARHEFTDPEKLDLGRKLIECRQSERRLESELDSLKSEYKGKLTKAETETNTVEAKLSNGFEMRETPAVIVFNHPEKGRKSAFRENTDGTLGDFLHTEAMTHADFQRPLFREEKQPTNEDLAESFDAVPTHEMPPMHLPEAHMQAPRATISVNGGPEMPFETKQDEAAATAVIEKSIAGKRAPFQQPPGTVDVNGSAEHWLVLDAEAPTTDVGLMSEFRTARKRAKWSEESIAFVVERMSEHKDVTSKRTVLLEYVFSHVAEEGAQ